jgi:hypothetical protein
MSTSHDPKKESLGETLKRGFLSLEPMELAIAIPLDGRSEAALREVFDEQASEPDAKTES